jgi:hypothetical protein
LRNDTKPSALETQSRPENIAMGWLEQPNSKAYSVCATFPF